jgi:hypothetical protein
VFPAVLVYRVIAFWLPIPPGIVAFLQLRRTVARWEREGRTAEGETPPEGQPAAGRRPPAGDERRPAGDERPILHKVK